MKAGLVKLASRDCGWVLLLLWCCLWSSITLFADALLARSGFKQLQALTFAPVEATVVDGKVAEDGGGEGATYEAKIRFRYVVAGQEFSGERYRHGFSVGNRSYIEKLVQDYPAGSRTTAHYNPADPAEALLSPGLSAEDFFILLCMTPFNLIMVGSWAALPSAMRCRSGVTPADFRIRDRGTELRVRPPRIVAIGAAGITALLVSFMLTIAVAFAIGAAPPSLVVALAWAALIAATGWVYRAFDSSKNDLLIDRVRSTLTLPPAVIWNPPTTIRLADIVGIEVGEAPSRNSDRDARIEYSCLVRWRGAGDEQLETTWHKQSDRTCTEELVAWLRGQCRLK